MHTTDCSVGGKVGPPPTPAPGPGPYFQTTQTLLRSDLRPGFLGCSSLGSVDDLKW